MALNNAPHDCYYSFKVRPRKECKNCFHRHNCREFEKRKRKFVEPIYRYTVNEKGEVVKNGV